MDREKDWGTEMVMVMVKDTDKDMDKVSEMD